MAATAVTPQNTNNASAQTPMNARSKKFLVWYLLIAVIVSGYLIYSLWSAPERAEGPPPTPSCLQENGNPKLTNLYPDRISLGSQLTDVSLIGCKLPKEAKVRINGAEIATVFVNEQHIKIRVASADLTSAGTKVEVLLTKDANEIGRGFLQIVVPVVEWRLLWFDPRPITYEVQLLLLVLVVGAFASSIYALKSIADYAGDNKLFQTWFTFYVIQPFEGAGSAFLFYLLIRAGLLTGTAADIKTENRVGILAIAALAGAFSDTAFLKLREIFQNLLKPKDDRGGKLAMKITTTGLGPCVVGTPYTCTLQTIRGTPPMLWSVNPDLPDGLQLDPATGTISGTAKKTLEKTVFKFTVIDSSTPPETAIAELTFEIKAAENAATGQATVVTQPDTVTVTPGSTAAQPAQVGTTQGAATATDVEAIDGCDVAVQTATLDEELPPTEGGVA